MKNRKFPFIALEGIDGSGKTTCAKIVAEKLNAQYYKTTSSIFEKVRSEIEELKDAKVRFLFYLTATVYASNEIRELLPKKPVVCDRYLYSTLTYHKSLGVDTSCLNIDKLRIIRPDFCFYLYADDAVIRERVSKREHKSRSDLELEKNKELQKKIHEEFMILPLIKIDTTEMDIEETCDKILLKIRK
jgi:dTMP kinase